MSRLRLLPSLCISLVLTLACETTPTGNEEDSDSAGTSGDGDGDGDGASSSSASSTSGSSTSDSGSGSSGSGDDEPVVNCDPADEMSCPDGQKCTVLEQGGEYIYDCVPDDSSKLPNEVCSVALSTGQDQCPTGHACIPNSPDSTIGLCLELCLEDDSCEAALCAPPPGFDISVCAAICDPLAPFCGEQQTCQRIRGSAFVCQFVRPNDTGSTADPCDIVSDAGCGEGFVCETGSVVADCVDQQCCTPLCDLSDADTCQSPMVCGDLPLDPIPGLENVGACYVPQ